MRDALVAIGENINSEAKNLNLGKTLVITEYKNNKCTDHRMMNGFFSRKVIPVVSEQKPIVDENNPRYAILTKEGEQTFIQTFYTLDQITHSVTYIATGECLQDTHSLIENYYIAEEMDHVRLADANTMIEKLLQTHFLKYDNSSKSTVRKVLSNFITTPSFLNITLSDEFTHVISSVAIDATDIFKQCLYEGVNPEFIKRAFFNSIYDRSIEYSKYDWIRPANATVTVDGILANPKVLIQRIVSDLINSKHLREYTYNITRKGFKFIGNVTSKGLELGKKGGAWVRDHEKTQRGLKFAGNAASKGWELTKRGWAWLRGNDYTPPQTCHTVTKDEDGNVYVVVFNLLMQSQAQTLFEAQQIVKKTFPDIPVPCEDAKDIKIQVLQDNVSTPLPPTTSRSFLPNPPNYTAFPSSTDHIGGDEDEDFE
eukprot:Pgem_evm1s1963